MPSSRRAGQRGQPREAHSFLEGPAFGPDGNLYVADIPFGRIFRVTPGGQVELAVQYEGEPTGMKILANGLARVTDQLRGLIQIDFKTGEVAAVAPRRYAEGYRGLNDLCIGQSGEVYFTETGFSDMSDPTGRVYRLDPDMTQHVLIRNGPGPNGVVLSPDENTLYVGMTRANSIWRCPLMVDGGSTKVSAFITLSGGQGPDGIAIDESGGLAVAHVGLGVVWVFDAKGEPVLRIESPVGDLTTNLAFGGPDRRTLFITEAHSGSILAARVDIPGLARRW
ncbi:SMP-30/gluconolactonase/LRE family protein [Pigmentiphaga soli]|uniref:SMP-30/gluconolactonase/LRE family protein n=1 Tax=Pigmentiphaga soli TaxID=1007095 RepID=A0ABP8GQZ3_9BURK